MTGRGFKTTPADMHRVAAMPATPTAKKSSARLSDSYIDTIWDQLRDKPDAFPILIRDTETKGFQIRIGRRRLAWQFEHERSDHGKRIYTCKALGFFDPGLHAGQTIHREAWHVDCDTARKAATIIAGQVLQGTAPASRRAGVKFADAFAEYMSPTWNTKPVSTASPPVGVTTSRRSAIRSCCRNGRPGL